MLEVIGAGNPDYKGQDWADVWANSPEHQALTEEIDRIVQSPKQGQGGSAASEKGKYAMPYWTQIYQTSKRSFIAYWRTPNYTVVSHIFPLFAGIW